MGLDLTSYDPMLKEHYSSINVPNIAFQKNPALGMLRKKSKLPGGGREWNQPFQVAYGGGGSSTFSVAMAANNNNSQYNAWKVPRAKHYRLAQVDGETIEATSSGDMDAFAPAFDEFDKTIEAEANWINFRFYRSKGGSIGRMTNTNFATTAVTIDDAAGTWGVVKNDVLNLSATDGTTGAIKVGTLVVAAVSRAPSTTLTGTITMTATIATGVSTAAANDYIFLKGDFGLAPAGLADWLPIVAPTSALFFGVDRTSEVELLGGLRIDNSTAGAPLHELFTDMAAQIDNMGGDPTIALLHPIQAATLSKQLDGKWVTLKAKGFDGGDDADIGYNGFQVNFSGHDVVLMTDRMCPVNLTYMIDWDMLTMFSAGPCPNFLQKRAGSIIKVSEAFDGYEARVGEYLNFVDRVPGRGCVGKLA